MNESLSAWAVLKNVLESEGSKVIFNSETNQVVWCPVSSLCESTADHDPECWMGQALRLIPTCDTEEPLKQ